MNPKKFKKGEHVYTDWGGGVKEVKKVNEEKQSRSMQIKLDETTAMGQYANMASVTHSREEFILDFIFIPPGSKQAKVISRIITSPSHAKRLHLALKDNIEKYEKKSGRKIDPSSEEGKIGF